MKTVCTTLLLVRALMIVPYAIFRTEGNCISYDLYLPAGGQYCAAEGAALYDMELHQCIYECLLSLNCAALNYNSTDDKCTFFYNACPLANEALTMEYIVFTKSPAHQCSEWIPYTSRDALDGRMIASQTGALMVSRIKYKGNYIIGYEYIPYGQCFTYTVVDEKTVSSGSSAPCERLRIADDCTALWVLYTARDPLPTRAVTGGHMVSGEVAYVTKFDILYNGETVTISGYYTKGAPNAVSAYIGLRISNTMMMLVILWEALYK